MRIRTDDEVYRVDAVWLGPPKATFPWRARYVAWGIGFALFFAIMGVERQINIGFDFFSTGWALIIAIAITKFIGSKINHERPLSAAFLMLLRELAAPRQTTKSTGGAVSVSRVRINQVRPRAGAKAAKRKQKADQKRPRQQQRRSQRIRTVTGGEVLGVRTPTQP